MDIKQVGKWSFIVGLVICLFAGIFAVPMIALVLFVLGLIVGFLNITTKETEKFLVATIALLMLGVGSLQALSILGTTIGGALDTVLTSFVAFVGAAALVVAVKSVISMSK
jgi:hypothetical protein